MIKMHKTWRDTASWVTYRKAFFNVNKPYVETFRLYICIKFEQIMESVGTPILNNALLEFFLKKDHK